MSNIEKVIELANRMIDDRIDMYGYEETIEYLLDLGCTPEDLTEYFEFDEEDINNVLNK